MTVNKLTTLAVLTAVALIIHVLESLIPVPVPVPGIKLGLANIVTLFMLFMPKMRDEEGQRSTVNRITGTGFSVFDVLAVLLCRIVLGALIAGRPVAVIYSLAGGLLAFCAQIALRRFVTDRQVWVCGAAGAVFHNIGQIAAAIILTETVSIAVYLPVLIIAGIFTGAVTGIVAGSAVRQIKKIFV